MGGGTTSPFSLKKTAQGLSPRGRGNQLELLFLQPSRRSIPAWAGEPRRGELATRPPRVYPRVGGGTDVRSGGTVQIIGLSPRGRGNRAAHRRVVHHRRSIPAWAGEPTEKSGPADESWVYPRVGGGTCIIGVAGELHSGLSPRGRGNRDEDRAAPSSQGSIPAWAGEPGTLSGAASSRWVYPRVGGGTP